MNTAKRFKLLVSFLLTMSFTCGIIAQNPPAANYSWRLDSLTYNHIYSVDANEPIQTQVERVYYDYDADGFSEIAVNVYGSNEAKKFIRFNTNQYKYVYRDFGENGRHTMYQYVYKYDWGRELVDNEPQVAISKIVDSAATAQALLSLDTTLFVPYRRYEYAYDTYRNIFDEDGHLIRQIRNYDYSVYSLDDSGNWKPISRTERNETDSTLFSKSYYFNTNEQKWKNQWRTYGRNKYRNHRLWIQEKLWDDGSLESGTEYNENGGIIRTYEGNSTYGNETYYRSGRITGKSSWAHARYNNWIDTTELITTTEIYLDDVFTRKTAKSNRRDEEYLVEKTIAGNKEYPQYVRSWKYNSDKVLTAYSNSVYTYDAENRCTLRLDTTLDNSVWINTLTEYDNEGTIIHFKKQEKRKAIDEWITTEENTPEYTFTTDVQWSANPIIRSLTKRYRYGFGNEYRWSETYNTENRQWECRFGTDIRVSLGENGEPLSAIEYDWRDYQWTPSYFYAFVYDTNLHAYAKNAVGYMSIGADGNVYSHNYKNGNITYYDEKGNEIGNYYSDYKYGSWQVKQYDEYGRIVSNITYRTNENKELVDTTQYEQYTYFPNDSSDAEARYVRRNKNLDTQTWQLGMDKKNTKSFNRYSKEGILLNVDTYGWEGDEIVLTHTQHHNDLTYDEQGRIKERITYYANNKRNMGYRYFYLDETDPKWYGMIQYGSWNESEQQWGGEHVPVFNDYVVLDELQRVVERTTFVMNADKTALKPATRVVYYYAGDAEDWTSADNYGWSTKNEWWCTGVSLNGYARTAVFDNGGNIMQLTTPGGSCEQGFADAKQYDYSYGADLTKEFVLSPRVYGMQEERNNENRPDFSPVASKRLKHIQYTDYLHSRANYTVTYHYTPLVDGLEEDQMPIEINPEETGAVFTWGAVEGAQTYVLHVYSDAAHMEEICYVIFDRNGMVLSIHFIPHAPAEQPESFRYTLSDLNPDTSYWYGVQALDSDGKTIESTYGSFHTKAAPATPTAVITSNVDRPETTTEKIIYRGQVYIRQGNTYYTILGQPVQL
ncbi:MAG: hypothetical protein IJT35_02155 [Paludibacteraceae bacterium]|nr:hypothetical protein [Paludibacteraceae bacterium]